MNPPPQINPSRHETMGILVIAAYATLGGAADGLEIAQLGQAKTLVLGAIALT